MVILLYLLQTFYFSIMMLVDHIALVEQKKGLMMDHGVIQSQQLILILFNIMMILH